MYLKCKQQHEKNIDTPNGSLYSDVSKLKIPLIV